MSAPARVRYGNLSRDARELIRYGCGDVVTIAGYVRHWFPEGVWRGDSCGCPDDRCVGFHHGQRDDCGCLPVTVGEYVATILAVDR